MLILIEGIVVCFILLLVCVVGLKDGPERYAVFYEEDVKKRVVGAWIYYREGTEEAFCYFGSGIMCSYANSCIGKGILHKWCL